MSIQVRKANERFHTQIDWLDSWHSFSFAEHYDPRHMGFRALRVINDDRVRGGAGFGMHPHRDMEIITYVLDGALAHKDSMGNGSVMRPGDVQRMTAGTGVLHSEMNPSPSEEVRLLQIWILPERMRLQPGYEQKNFPESERRGKLRLVAARDGRDGAVTVHQDVALYAGILSEGDRVFHEMPASRNAWLQVARGSIELNGTILKEGDGAAISETSKLEITGKSPSEILLFDLA